MKTRNIFAALAVGLFATIAVGNIGCTQSEEGKEIPGREFHDTIRTTDTIGKFNISKITVEAAGGHKEVEFTPDADWSFTSSADWLKVTTAKGTKTDRMLMFEVAENRSLEALVANTTLTVGGVKYPLTINQKAGVPEIKVFGAVSEFSEKRTSLTIKKIVSNVELEIASIPDWIASATIETDETGYWSISAQLKPASYDTDARTGDIVIKDKNSDVKVTIPVKCTPSSSDMKLETYGNFGWENPFPGIAVKEGDLSRVFTTFHKPGTLDEADPYTVLAYPATMAKYGGQVKEGAKLYENITIEKVTGGTAPSAAYIVQDWKVTVGEYIDTRDHGIALFIMKESEVEGFDPSIGYADINIDQLYGAYYKKGENPIFAFDFALANNEGTVAFSTYDAAGALTVDITGHKENVDPNFNTKFKGDLTQVSAVTPSATEGAGWTDYVYKVSSTRAQNDQIGLPNGLSLSSTTYNIRISSEKIDAINIASFKFMTNANNGKLKTAGDKFKFATWGEAGIESSEVTILYRVIAKDIMAAPAYSNAGNSSNFEIIEVSKQTEDTDNDGYLEYTYKLKTKNAIANPAPFEYDGVNIYHTGGMSHIGVKIPIGFTGWVKPAPPTE